MFIFLGDMIFRSVKAWVLVLYLWLFWRFYVSGVHVAETRRGISQRSFRSIWNIFDYFEIWTDFVFQTNRGVQNA